MPLRDAAAGFFPPEKPLATTTWQQDSPLSRSRSHCNYNLRPLARTLTRCRLSLPGTSADEKYITTNAYKAEKDDEIGYEKGVVVEVVEKNLDGWWRVRYQGKQGWTPGSYLTRLAVQDYKPSAIASLVDAEQRQETTTAAPAKPPVPAAPSKPKPPSAPDKPMSIDLAAVVKRPPMRRSSISRPNSIHGAKGKFNFAALAAESVADKGGAVDKDGGKKPPPAKPEPPKSASKKPSPLSGGVKSGNIGAPAGLGAIIGGLKPAAPAKDAKPKPTKPSPPPSAGGRKDEYQVISAIQKEDDSGISVPKDATVTVIERSDTGWWFIGYKGKEGWAPADFLQPASNGSVGTKASMSSVAAPKPAVPAAAVKPVIPKAAEKPVIPKAAEKPVIPKAAAKPVVPAATTKPVLPAASNKPKPGGVAALAGILAAQGPLADEARKPSMSAKPFSTATTGAGNEYRVVAAYTATGDTEISVKEGV